MSIIDRVVVIVLYVLSGVALGVGDGKWEGGFFLLFLVMCVLLAAIANRLKDIAQELKRRNER